MNQAPLAPLQAVDEKLAAATYTFDDLLDLESQARWKANNESWRKSKGK